MIYSISRSSSNQTVEMSIGKGKSWAGPLVTKKAVLDILKGDFLFNKGVILQEDHGWIYAHTIRSIHDNEEQDAPAAM